LNNSPGDDHDNIVSDNSLAAPEAIEDPSNPNSDHIDTIEDGEDDIKPKKARKVQKERIRDTINKARKELAGSGDGGYCSSVKC